MANEEKVIVTKSKLDALATSISTKSGQSLPMTIAQMKSAVDGISGGSILITDVANSTGITCVITTNAEPEPSVTWETVFNGTARQVGEPDPYWWIGELTDVYPVLGETWRITVDGTAYVTTAKFDASTIVIGNPLYNGGTDDGSGCPVCFFNAGWGAWSGGADSSFGYVDHTLKIERQVSA